MGRKAIAPTDLLGEQTGPKETNQPAQQEHGHAVDPDPEIQEPKGICE